MPFAFTLNFRVLLLALLLLPVLVGLGYWQLQRAAEKVAIQTVFETRRAQEPLAFDRVADEAEQAFLPVKLVGRFDNHRFFLLDNKVVDGKVGYEVLVPFQLLSQRWVMVNRGWVLAPPRRSDLPPVAAVSEELMELEAEIYVPSSEGYQLAGVEQASNWPKVITVFDSAYIQQQLGNEIFPHQLRIKAGQEGALVTDWPPINLSPAKHRAYALQWFAMAFALCLWLLFASFSHKRTDQKS